MTGGEKLIDIECELKRVQINYIQSELKKLKNFLSTYEDDIEFDHLRWGYEEMLERADSLDDQLTLYKQYYLAALKYLHDVTQDSRPPEEIEYVEEEKTDPNELAF